MEEEVWGVAVVVVVVVVVGFAVLAIAFVGKIQQSKRLTWCATSFLFLVGEQDLGVHLSTAQKELAEQEGLGNYKPFPQS